MNIHVKTLLAFLLAGLSLSPALAYLDEYTPISKADKRNKLPLKVVKDTGLKDGKTIKIASASMRLLPDSDDLELSGKDKNGKRWTLTKNYFGLGTVFFTRDLDLNGTEDIIMLQATGACGIAPPAVLSFILFERNGQPFPMEVSGYACSDDGWSETKKTAHIDELISIGPDKRAVLVCNQLDSAETNGRYHSYWRTVMYRVKEARWERLNSYQNCAQPMIVKYTFKSNHKVIPPPVPALKKFDDGEFVQAQKKNCKTGTITITKEPDRTIVRIGDDSYEQERPCFFESFIISEGKELSIASLDCALGKKLFQEFADNKVTVRYLKPAMQRAPLLIWPLM